MTDWKSDFLTAIDEDQLYLLYQPQMTADGARMVAVEALVRWHHPTDGPLGSGAFVDKVEQHGLEQELGAWVLEAACREALAWPQIGLAVNVSAQQFRDERFVGGVLGTVERLGFDPTRLELEIVESTFIDDFEVTSAAIDRLRAAGIRIALDDFGTGYSSLTYLRRLPLDKIKIDQSFVREIDQMQSAAIVHAVVALARALGLKITAEGVETEEQQRFMKAAGCHYLQGYRFARPLDPQALTAMLKDLGQA